MVKMLSTERKPSILQQINVKLINVKIKIELSYAFKTFMRLRSVQLELSAEKKKAGGYEECRKTSEGHKKKVSNYICFLSLLWSFEGEKWS